jgi:NAD-dependent DNA ligase
MPKQIIQNLISELHQSFGDIEPSAKQQMLLAEVQRHMHETGAPEVEDEAFSETLQKLLEELKTDHPAGAAIIGQIMKVLADIGV